MNVRHLILKTCSHLFEFDGIRFMLKSCPLLETLTINNLGPAMIFLNFVPPFELNPEEFWTKNLIILSCIETSLKVVEVFGFQGTGNEVLMLQYLILFGSVLEEVNLYLSQEDDGYGGNRENYRKIAEWMQRDIESASHKLRISIY
ncbi:hypothetical protein Q3G72_007627 [Acer saccharum]|nr:hypothetical protein Q3G72_007627 [Acer saccharum]